MCASVKWTKWKLLNTESGFTLPVTFIYTHDVYSLTVLIPFTQLEVMNVAQELFEAFDSNSQLLVERETTSPLNHGFQTTLQVVCGDSKPE